jgi:hypothetical protein
MLVASDTSCKRLEHLPIIIKVEVCLIVDVEKVPVRLEGAVIDIALMLATVDQLVVVSVGKAVELAVDIGLVGIATLVSADCAA